MIATRPHLRRFEAHYRPIGYVYGRGLGFCDAAAPNARFAFRGTYRPHEAPDVYFMRVEDALRLDGWRVVPSRGTARPAAVLGSATTTLTADIVSPGLQTSPEIVELDVRADPRLPDVAIALPETGPSKAESDDLMQFTMFYPRALPRGWKLDDTSQKLAVDYSVRDYLVSDDRGRASRIDERLAPVPTGDVCASFGNANQNLRDPRYACRRVGSANGCAVYRLPHRDPDYDEYGVLMDDDAVTLAIARRAMPGLDQSEILALLATVEPTNPGHERPRPTPQALVTSRCGSRSSRA